MERQKGKETEEKQPSWQAFQAFIHRDWANGYRKATCKAFPGDRGFLLLVRSCAIGQPASKEMDSKLSYWGGG